MNLFEEELLVLVRPKWFMLTVMILLLCMPSAAICEDSCTTPLDIFSPVYAGTKIIGYENGTAGCPVFIYATSLTGTVELVGAPTTVSPVGWGPVALKRALKEGEVITGKQNDQSGFPTWSSRVPVVAKIPSSDLINGEKFKMPGIDPPTVACQNGFNVSGLVEGARAGFQETGQSNASGVAWSPYGHIFLGVRGGLKKNDHLASWQDMEKNFPLRSDSFKTAVKGRPNDLPAPEIPELDEFVPAVVTGSPILSVCNLWAGATVDIYEIDPSLDAAQQDIMKEKVGGGIAVDTCTLYYLKHPLLKGRAYFARQSLCSVFKDGKAVSPTDWISRPVVCEPLCQGDTQVVASQTQRGSTVFVRVKTQGKEIISTATAPGYVTVIPLSGGQPLNTGDSVSVKEANQLLDSDWGILESTVMSKELCEAWKSKEPWKPQPYCESPRFWPIPGANQSWSGQNSTKHCPNEGASCMVHPSECYGRGADWKVPGKIVCQGEVDVCQAKPYVDYCQYGDQSGCGGAIGNSCSNDSDCVPGTTCQSVNPVSSPGEKRCKAIGLGCTPVPGLCWTKSELGTPQLGCIEGKP